MKQDKRGVEINVSTIIIVILAVLVLVILALYFTGGMKTLFSQITGIGGSYSATDIENAQNVCALRCTANDVNYFCTHEFNIREVDKNGQITGESETFFCYSDEIGAEKLAECKAAGISKASCTA